VKEEYRGEGGLEEFFAAREQFEMLVNQLHSGGAASLAHGDIEAIVHREGTELLRRLFQAHLDWRANQEARRAEVIGADGIERTHVRINCKRTLTSLFGDVLVRRIGYGARGNDSLFPLDGELNLPCDQYSHGLSERANREVGNQAFDGVVANMKRLPGGKAPKRQLQGMAIKASQDFEAFYAANEAAAPESSEDLLILSVDGKGIVMREEGLREATRKAAQRQCRKLTTRLCRGEKRNRKRMATVAAVYSVKPHLRTPESIMETPSPGAGPPRPKPANKRVWASVERQPMSVIEEQFQEALRRDPARRRQWVMLVDGQQHQLDLIRECMKRHQAEPILVLDFIHVLEYVWKAAYCFHNEASEEAEQWVRERTLRILQGKASAVAGGMRRSATLRKMTADERKAVDKCADYLLGYPGMLNYDEFLAQGLPIATGVIEGACRHLIKDRMDITGARWSLQGAEAVLKLRSLQSSGDFDDYWEFHKAMSYARNHASRYANPGRQRTAM
jgi:hypothetical protein